MCASVLEYNKTRLRSVHLQKHQLQYGFVKGTKRIWTRKALFIERKSQEIFNFRIVD